MKSDDYKNRSKKDKLEEKWRKSSPKHVEGADVYIRNVWCLNEIDFWGLSVWGHRLLATQSMLSIDLWGSLYRTCNGICGVSGRNRRGEFPPSASRVTNVRKMSWAAKHTCLKYKSSSRHFILTFITPRQSSYDEIRFVTNFTLVTILITYDV